MAKSEGQAAGASVLDSIRQLVAVAQVDVLYRDLFLARAAEQLGQTLSESAYRELQQRAPHINVLLAENRSAVERQDWVQVKTLSGQVAGLRKQLDEHAAELDLGKQVYDGPPVVVDPFCVELQPMLARPIGAAAARESALDALARLLQLDPGGADWYRQRQADLTAVHAREAVVADTPSAKGASQLKEQAQRAAEAGDVERLRALADEILAAQAAPEEKQGGSEPHPVVQLDLPPEAQGPFPTAAVERGRALGFAHVETKPVSPQAGRLLAEFTARYAWRPAVEVEEVTREGAVRLRELTREINAPPELAEPAGELALLFAIHPFVNSAGVRYLIHYGSEYVLVEDFPESDEPPADSELLTALGLPRRRGLARVEIERALRERGGSLLHDRLGLDPRQFRLVCLPYDVYLRAGRDLGWGHQPRWTHVDGYQLVRGGHLRALVAGDTRYGGLFDLCAIAADDARDGVIARFAVVRRARMAIGRS